MTAERTTRFPLPAILLFAALFYASLLTRMVFSPLLIDIEGDLGLTHAQAGIFFLLLSAGYTVTMLGSGFVSERLTHRGTILISLFATAAAALLIGTGSSLTLVRIATLLLGASSGLYLSSAMTSLYDLVSARHRGKAIGIHELGPNAALVTAPLIVEGLRRILEWRSVFLVLAGGVFLMGVIFAAFGRGGRFAGEPPKLSTVRLFIRSRTYWIVTIVFCIVAATGIGGYAVLPTYLVAERGMDRSLVNLLVGLSRLSGVLLVFFAGWLTDHISAKKLMGIICGVVGLMTVLLGSLRGAGLIACVFLQPILIPAFFPAGFAAIADLGPPRTRNVAVSLVIVFVSLIGGGAAPSALAALGDYWSFSAGFIILGSLLLASPLLLLFLRLPDKPGG